MTALQKRLERDILAADRTYLVYVENKRRNEVRREIWAQKWERRFGKRPV
jgi:hypothetical protein